VLRWLFIVTAILRTGFEGGWLVLLVVGVVVVVVVRLLGWSLLGEDSVSTLESWLPIIINNNNIYI
jgi:hypothetical protein